MRITPIFHEIDRGSYKSLRLDTDEMLSKSKREWARMGG